MEGSWRLRGGVVEWFHPVKPQQSAPKQRLQNKRIPSLHQNLGVFPGGVKITAYYSTLAANFGIAK